VKLPGGSFRVGGMAKGAGMIDPNMATMLCVVTTDAKLSKGTLQNALHHAVERSFNRITIDGDMSTNDTVLVLANGLAGNDAKACSNLKSKDFAAFQAALQHVCLELAKKIVRDGEGVHRVVTVKVSGAKSIADADAAARAVANSALVKTSWHGGDPNWGRIIDALGYSPATIAEDRVDIGYSASGSRKILWSLKRGQPTKATFRDLCAAVAPREFDLHIRLNLGKGEAVMYAADLTEEYVDFNKGDVTDPGSLGG
jgi:glutamate N-acetyltransferase/amino-acid N-acetyltransferase